MDGNAIKRKSISAKKDRRTNFLSSIVIVLIVLYKFLLIFEVNEYYVVMVLPIILFACILHAYIVGRVNKRRVGRLVFIAVPVLVVSLITKSANFFLPLLVAASSTEEDKRVIAKKFGISILAFSLLTIILWRVGVLNDVQLLRGSLVRHSYGFLHPNGLGNSVACGLISLLYTYRNNTKLCIAAAIITLIVYKYSYSRTALVMMVAYFAILLITRLCKKNILKRAYILYWIFFIITLLTSLFPKVDAVKGMDTLFSNRIEINASFAKSGGFTEMFPNTELLESESLAIDNYYISLLIRFGLIGFIVFMVFNTKTIKQLSNDNELMIVVAVFALSTLSESTAMVASSNFLLSLQAIAYVRGDNCCQANDAIAGAA